VRCGGTHVGIERFGLRSRGHLHNVETMPTSPAPRLELSLPKIVAGALAAASAAVASSWLGVAGTVFGAVVVSVVATVGTALYSHSLERSRQAIQETIPVLGQRSRDDRDDVVGPETLELSAVTSPAQRRPIDWSAVVVSCVATLALGCGALTAFEAVVGKSASELTGSSSSGATTLSSLVDGAAGPSDTSQLTTPSPPSGGTTTPSSTSKSPTSTTPTPTLPTTSGPTTPTTTGPPSTDPTSTEPTTTEPTTTEPTTTGSTSTSPTATETATHEPG
jgi:hypothetical protein